MKFCSKCERTLDSSAFNRDKHEVDGLSLRCGECNRAYRRSLYAEPHRKKRINASSQSYRNTESGQRSRFKSALKSRYGMTVLQYAKMMKAQDDRCDICAKSFGDGLTAPAVDHNHTTTHVRAILCKACNFMLGYAYEEPDVLRSAALYIERFLK